MRGKRISTSQAIRQVCGAFPDAHPVYGGAGWVIVSGDRELSDQPGGFVGSTGQAWLDALNHVIRLHRDGLLQHKRDMPEGAR